MARYKKKLDEDIRCPLEYRLTVFGLNGSHVSFAFYLQVNHYATVKCAEKCVM